MPVGVAVFAYDITQSVRPLAERLYDIRHWSEFDRGGHFAAMEVPELLAQDVRDFFLPRHEHDFLPAMSTTGRLAPAECPGGEPPGRQRSGSAISVHSAVDRGDTNPPRVRVHLGDGLWLTLRAARIGDAEPPGHRDSAVTIEESSPAERITNFHQGVRSERPGGRAARPSGEGRRQRDPGQSDGRDQAHRAGSPQVHLRQDLYEQPQHAAHPRTCSARPTSAPAKAPTATMAGLTAFGRGAPSAGRSGPDPAGGALRHARGPSRGLAVRGQPRLPRSRRSARPAAVKAAISWSPPSVKWAQLS